MPDGAPEPPDDAFAVARLRGLSPEQFAWSLLQATERIDLHVAQWDANQKKEDSKADGRPAAQSPGKPPEALPDWKRRLAQLEALDRHARTLSAIFAGLPGQPDGDFQPVVDQALHLLNSPAALALVKDAPLLARLSEIDAPDHLADELYLSLFSRRPEAEETAEVHHALDSSRTPQARREALRPLVWGLLLSSEFRLSH